MYKKIKNREYLSQYDKMASDRDRFQLAIEGWNELKRDECLSVDNTIGKLAIFCAPTVLDITEYTKEDEIKKTREKDEKDNQIMVAEAHAIADEDLYKGGVAEVILNPTDTDFADVLTDPSFCDIITIGHGSMSSLWYYDGEEYLTDWFEFSSMADHLKTGEFIQRQCGIFRGGLSVPLGMFVVSDFESVVAAFGQSFEPEIYPGDPEEEKLIRPFKFIAPTYEGIKAGFRYIDQLDTID